MGESWRREVNKLFQALTGSDALKRDNDRLTELNADLNLQLTELRKHKTISPEQEAHNARVARDFKANDEEIQALAIWLRNNKAKEIGQGKHMGMKLNEICIMYMARSCE